MTYASGNVEDSASVEVMVADPCEHVIDQFPTGGVVPVTHT